LRKTRKVSWGDGRASVTTLHALDREDQPLVVYSYCLKTSWHLKKELLAPSVRSYLHDNHPLLGAEVVLQV